MVLTQSELWAIRSIPSSGRGVVAVRPISDNALVLKSDPPSAHVIFRDYSKEVCAYCLHYDDSRTLPVRLRSIGKVFCTSECQSKWLDEQGDLGLEAWKRLHVFLQAKRKAITNHASLDLLAPKPTAEQIQISWQDAEQSAETVRQIRTYAESELDSGTTDQTNPTCYLQHHLTHAVDSDALSFLLSGILFLHKQSERWESTILPLAMDQTPFRNVPDMEAHSNSFVQLTAIVPIDILPAVTSQVYQTLINAASHNSFGIRAGNEGEEYMGYALYPDSSYFNHSCSPNIAKKRTGNIWEFRASRDIEAGEECCITYLGGDEKELSVAERRKRLQESWGFECMCVRCQEGRTP